MRTPIVLLLTLTLSSSFALAGKSCPLVAEIAPKTSFELPLTSDAETDRLSKQLVTRIQANPQTVRYEVMTTLEQSLEPLLNQGQDFLAFLVKEDGAHSLNSELQLLLESSRHFSSAHEKLLAVLEPTLWRRTVRQMNLVKDSSMAAKADSIADEMRICRERAAICQIRIKSKVDEINAHVERVQNLRLEIESQLTRTRVALLQLTHAGLGDIELAQALSSAENIMLPLEMIEENLANHLEIIRVHLGTSEQMLATIPTTKALVEIAISKGLSADARLMATESELQARSQAPLLTFKEEKVIASARRLKMNENPKVVREAFDNLAQINDWRSTNEILRIITFYNYSKDETKSVLKDRTFNLLNEPFLVKMINRKNSSAYWIFDLIAANPSEDATDLLFALERHESWAMHSLKGRALDDSRLPALEEMYDREFEKNLATTRSVLEIIATIQTKAGQELYKKLSAIERKRTEGFERDQRRARDEWRRNHKPGGPILVF